VISQKLEVPIARGRQEDSFRPLRQSEPLGCLASGKRKICGHRTLEIMQQPLWFQAHIEEHDFRIIYIP
jgi:hypothetical protein